MKLKKRYPTLLVILTLLITAYFNTEYRAEDYGVSAITIFDQEFYLKQEVSSGPYIFQEDSLYTIKWLDKGKVETKTTKHNEFGGLQSNSTTNLDTSWFKLNHSFTPNYTQQFTTSEKIVALSDIHGQNGVFVNLLTTHKIIDADQNWNFGKGHLVIVGDVFDRGDQTSEALWLLYKLEQQAKKAGGMVHITLGNHEMMVLTNDLRYLHEVDVISAEKLGLTFTELYSEINFLGKWLKAKPAMLSINDILFIHGGASKALIDSKLTIAEINKEFNNNIIGKTRKIIKANPLTSLLGGGKGPLWYRGYFKPEEFKEATLDKILAYFNKQQIVVGHTSQKKIVSLFGGKVYAVDSSIKRGESGMLLINEDGEFFQGDYQGIVTKF